MGKKLQPLLKWWARIELLDSVLGVWERTPKRVRQWIGNTVIWVLTPLAGALVGVLAWVEDQPTSVVIVLTLATPVLLLFLMNQMAWRNSWSVNAAVWGKVHGKLGPAVQFEVSKDVVGFVLFLEVTNAGPPTGIREFRTFAKPPHKPEVEGSVAPPPKDLDAIADTAHITFTARDHFWEKMRGPGFIPPGATIMGWVCTVFEGVEASDLTQVGASISVRFQDAYNRSYEFVLPFQKIMSQYMKETDNFINVITSGLQRGSQEDEKTK